MTWPEPRPCKRKWGRVPFEQMLRHIKQDKCEQCRALVLYLERKSENRQISAEEPELEFVPFTFPLRYRPDRFFTGLSFGRR